MPSDGPVTDEVTEVLRRLERLQSTVYALEEDRDRLNATLEASLADASASAKEVRQGRIEIAKLVDQRRKLSAQLATEKANHQQTIKQRNVSDAESSKFASAYLRVIDLMGRWEGLSFTMNGTQAAKALREAINDAGFPAATEPPAGAAPARPNAATLRAMRDAARKIGNDVMPPEDASWYQFADLLDAQVGKAENQT